ncbi:hypothetical protein [Antiquaquibacter soli]|uniref:PilN domain-containing protein n=1 Tax=Antiquaquibacter soli TaxID=3064523 RepID=A0ABT9BP96_9MICO|nr:hypothetical protein [Protaetiibacter sp. WY-16]MDO7882853.1 hypothetical protein [Protaetiibacter sp. WY-16]
MSARAAKTTPGLVLGAQPRANLLPPEVIERAKARRVRGYLVLLVVVVLIATAAGYAYASIQALTAQAGLAAAQARTSELLEEKATYSDVISATSGLALITSTQQQATSTEVMWSDLMQELILAAPGQVILVNKMTGLAPMPWEAPMLVTGSLRTPRVASLELRYVSPTPPEATRLYRAFAGVDGVADVSIDSVEWLDDLKVFATTVTINFDADALSARWGEDEDEDESTDGTSTDGAETNDEEGSDEGQ